MEPSVHLEAVLTIFEVDFEVLERLSWTRCIMLGEEGGSVSAL